MPLDERISDLLLQWEEAREQGRDLTPEELCRDCPALLPEIDRHVQDLRKLAPLLDGETTPPVAPAMTCANAPESRAGTKGELRYTPRRLHAVGGLGQVYKAHDEELNRDVALKRIKEEFADNPAYRLEFLREAEITGKLEHPGVVPIYGLVRGPDGNPAYAMRFVEGESLRDAIRKFHEADKGNRDSGERSLALRQLLSRFIAVCNTLAFAHNRGVIHRDLKPANIMLGKYGETLVVDWGLARPFDRTETERASGEATLRPTPRDGEAPDATRFGEVKGTPSYMSPEQAEGIGQRIGPASDIYSLGATLYELLTGLAPVRGCDGGDIILKVRRGEFSTPHAVKRNISKSLEAICLKAMALEPQKRYATALEMANDVDRWLADEPTTAYHEPWRVRAWRWVRRHRTPVTATAAALLAAALLVGGGLLWKADHDARAMAAAARQAEERDRDIQAGLAQTALLRDQGRLGEAGKVLEGAEKLAANGAPAALVERAQQARKDLDMVAALEKVPLLAMRDVVGGWWEGVPEGYRKAFQQYGIDMEGLDQADAAAQIRGSDIREHLIVALHAWASHLRFERRVLFGRLLEAALLADKVPDLQDLQELMIADREAFERWRERHDRHELMIAGWDRESLERMLVRYDESLLPPTTALAISNRLSAMGSVARSEQLLRAAQHGHPNDFFINLALFMMLSETAPRLEEAIGFLRAAVALRPDCSLAHFSLGVALKTQGRSHEAEKEFRQAIHFKEDDPTAHYILGTLLAKRGKRDEAENEFRRAIQLKEDDPDAHMNLGILLGQLGKRDEAEKEFRRAIELKEDDPGAHYNFGTLLAMRGKRDEAEKEFRRAIQLKDEDTDAHWGLGILLGETGNYDEAILCFQRVLKLLPLDDPRRPQLEKSISLSKRLRALDSRLPGVLSGEVQVDAAERVEFAMVCLCKGRNAASARLFAEAFAQQPTLADDLSSKNRYNAALAATLAGIGQGDDASDLDNKERARLRNQALDWLQADLTAWAKRRQDDPKARTEIQEELQGWQDDGGLAGVREADALAKLPEAEREAWRKLWADVDALVKELRDGK